MFLCPTCVRQIVCEQLHSVSLLVMNSRTGVQVTCSCLMNLDFFFLRFQGMNAMIEFSYVHVNTVVEKLILRLSNICVLLPIHLPVFLFFICLLGVNQREISD